MKKVSLFLLVTTMLLTAMSQDITVEFTGRMYDSTYIRLDSVKVENISRSWTETLIYPDTVITFNTSGIEQVSNPCAEIKAFPNPFNGNTTLSLQIAETDNVAMHIYNLSGQKVAEYS